jgi:hypothetical protein
MYIDHQQKATLVNNMGKLRKLSVLKTTIGMWAMTAKGTEWQIAVQLENMEVDKGNYFSTP